MINTLEDIRRLGFKVIYDDLPHIWIQSTPLRWLLIITEFTFSLNSLALMAPLKLKTVCSGQEYHEHFNGFSLDQKKKKKNTYSE